VVHFSAATVCFPATFSAKSVASFSGFVEENPQGINSIILWIGLIIVELWFVDLFWVFYSWLDYGGLILLGHWLMVSDSSVGFWYPVLDVGRMVVWGWFGVCFGYAWYLGIGDFLFGVPVGMLAVSWVIGCVYCDGGSLWLTDFRMI